MISARRFLLKVDVQPDDGCWEWTGARSTTRRRDGVGYGQMTVNGTHQRAHRVAYEIFVGPIPDDLEIDHLCFNPGCVRPDHLEAVTHEENIRRAVAAGRFHLDHQPRPDEHGATLTHYTKHGCRCTPCVDAYNEYQREWFRKNRPPAGRPLGAHGEVLTHYVRGCRCEPCTTAWRTYQTNYRAKRRSSAGPA